MAMHGNLSSSGLIDDAVRKLEEVGFNDDDYGDLAAICEDALHEYGKLGHATIGSNPDILAMTVSMKIVMECARKLDEARIMKLELRDKSDVEISTPEILAMGDVAFTGWRRSDGWK